MDWLEVERVMQKNSPVLYVVLFALVSLAIGIVSNVASGQFPDWLQPYLWLSWPLLAILVALAIALGIYDATRQPRDANASKEIVVKFAPPQEPQNISSPAPIPPAPYYPHSYALQENFTGRQHERTVLSEWFARDAQSVFVLDAIGGMGKSALAWVWTDEISHSVRNDSRPDGVFWWSFYEDRELAHFLDRALAYVSGGALNGRAFASDRERADALLVQLREKRFLFVLDGLERALRAYARMDAAYRGDAFDADAHDEYRACVDPNAGVLLRGLAVNAGKTKTLVTTRLLPRELDGLAGVMHVALTGLNPQDAADFFEKQNIKGTRAEIETVCAEYGYHPLSLRLLSGALGHDPRFQRDIKFAPRVNPLDQDQERKSLDFAYNALPPRQQQLVSQIAAFRSPLAWDSLAAIFTTPPKLKNPVSRLFVQADFKNENEFVHLINDLHSRGLLQRDTASETYDLHPVVRRYCYDRLSDKPKTHAVFIIYFEKIETPRQVNTLTDLMPVIELYHHTVNAGRYDEARELYRDRLSSPLYFQFGAYQTQAELLRALFPDGEDKPPRLKSERDKSWTLNALANSYSLAGQPRRAVPLFLQCAAIDEKAGDKENLAIDLGNVADDQLKIGELEAAERNLRRRIELCREIEYEFGQAGGHQELGRVLAYRGEFAEAERELETAFTVFVKINHLQGQGLTMAYRSLRALLMGDASAALEHAHKARWFAEETARTRMVVERDFVRAEWLIGAACAALGSDAFEMLSEAERHLTEALIRDRRINLLELEAAILLEFARLRMAQARQQSTENKTQTTVIGHVHTVASRMDEALDFANQALRIAERSEYRLDQADIHNFLAEWYWQQAQWKRGDALAPAREFSKQKAREHAQRAKERAWCDGPPHYYKPAYARAEKMLAELAG